MATNAAAAPATSRRLPKRFLRYSSVSLLTVPAGYVLLLVASDRWDVNAGLLNLALGTVLTLPSFLLYRRVVWREGSGRGTGADLISYWQTVMLSALVPSAAIAIADAWFRAEGLSLVLVGLLVQSIVFLVRFIWLDRVTFSLHSRLAGRHADGS